MTEHDMGWTRGNWRTIPGLNGYEASYSGRLRKLTRNGPRIVKPNGIGPCGFFTVQIPETGQFHQLGKLTAAAWLGPKPDGLTVRYLDGNLQNHTVPNLAYGTWAEIQADQAARAEREEAAGAPTHCEQGHRLAPTWSGGWGERVCPECRSEDNRRLYRERPREWREIQDKTCQQCRTLVPSVHYTRRLCDDCRDGNLAAYRERQRARNRKPPRHYVCHGCQSEQQAPTTGPLPKWCPPCKKTAQAEASLRWYERKKQSQ